ncbi:MAG: hypothetical protein V4622_08485 [Bacteroidota bacterium]
MLLFCFQILTACPGSVNKDKGLKKLKANHYDFSDFKRFYHKGIYFYLPDYFSQDYNKAYLYKKDGISLASYSSGIYFSCERFDEEELKDYKFAFEDKKSDVEVVHAFYLEQRKKSFDNAKVSFLHKIKRKNNFKAVYQVAEGSKYAFGSEMNYYIATTEKKVKNQTYYYVFQLISSKEMSAYLLDDFRKMLRDLE